MNTTDTTEVVEAEPQTGCWIEVTPDTPFPKQTREVLSRNDRQGGTLLLISWNPTHHHFQTKGEWISIYNLGTHYLHIP